MSAPLRVSIIRLRHCNKMLLIPVAWSIRWHLCSCEIDARKIINIELSICVTESVWFMGNNRTRTRIIIWRNSWRGAEEGCTAWPHKFYMKIHVDVKRIGFIAIGFIPHASRGSVFDFIHKKAAAFHEHVKYWSWIQVNNWIIIALRWHFKWPTKSRRSRTEFDERLTTENKA